MTDTIPNTLTVNGRLVVPIDTLLQQAQAHGMAGMVAMLVETALRSNPSNVDALYWKARLPKGAASGGAA